ncbi:NAD-dependent epimerase/dehydratase family protein [Streptomyces sp. H23]|uniref:NAD-dependent epimerase/dehydratase family protein n=1 Tax=Streptomyces sp. H23 TaxID=2541723 RepID=UPI00106E3341|nr:NAD-dependent epimerase/dehydratase family protein [Streptomyces sp. H23]
MPAQPSALVLGGTGFVGRHVCEGLDRSGFDVVAVARRPPADSVGGRFRPLDLGRQPVGEVAAVLAETSPAVVVNAVGSIWGHSDPEMWDAAAAPTLRLLDALALSGARPRVIHLGSVLEYGRVEAGTIMGAATAARPTSAYGRAKLAATRAVLDRVRAGRFDGMVLRAANLAGPGSPDVSLLGRVATRLAQAGPDGVARVELDPLLARRDYVDVRDVADAVVAAATTSLSGELVDIGRGESVPVRTLVDLLIARSGVPARVVERPGAGIRHSTEEWSRVDIAPAARLLGWRPRRSLAEAVEDFWHDFLRRHHTTDQKRSAH